MLSDLVTKGNYEDLRRRVEDGDSGGCSPRQRQKRTVLEAAIPENYKNYVIEYELYQYMSVHLYLQSVLVKEVSVHWSICP